MTPRVTLRAWITAAVNESQARGIVESVTDTAKVDIVDRRGCIGLGKGHFNLWTWTPASVIFVHSVESGKCGRGFHFDRVL